MDTRITDELRNTHAGQVAEEVLRKWVLGGFGRGPGRPYHWLGDSSTARAGAST
jgi:hypothetical protein